MKVYGYTRRIVIDTNVVVSALISPSGNSAKFFGDVLDGKYEVVITKSILDEYDLVLHRDKLIE